MVFEPNEIADWSSDDRYLADKVATRLGIQILD
jgi:hypothetical protein